MMICGTNTNGDRSGGATFPCGGLRHRPSIRYSGAVLYASCILIYDIAFLRLAAPSMCIRYYGSCANGYLCSCVAYLERILQFKPVYAPARRVQRSCPSSTTSWSMSTAAYRPIAPITHQRNIFSQPVSALCFDPVSDTLWAGTNAGNAVAYYTPRGMRGVTFRVGGDLAVRDILADESSVFASGVDSNGVGAWTKGGVNKWYHRCVLSQFLDQIGLDAREGLLPL